jgi:hypothetical protein
MKTLPSILAAAVLGGTLLLAQAPDPVPFTGPTATAGFAGPQRLGDEAQLVIDVDGHHRHHYHHRRHRDDRRG